MASTGQSSEYGATSGAPSGATSGVSTEAPPPTEPSQPPQSKHVVTILPTLTKNSQNIPDTIQRGKSLRVQKNTLPKRSAKPPPTPAMPRGMVATDRDVRMSRRAMRRQAKCLRKHNIVLSDRMDELSKPTRRQLIAMWRTYADVLTPEQIINLQTMLDASDPFKPDQAYEYFVNLKRQRKRNEEKEKSAGGKKDGKKDLSALCGDRRFAWARSATVAFARGIQQRLSRPGNFQLDGGMQRLSDIVLDEMCSYSKMRPPSRLSKNPKAMFMVEMADKIAVWIDEILEESDERMLMMDFDEDDEEVEVEEAKRKRDEEKREKERLEKERLEKEKQEKEQREKEEREKEEKERKALEELNKPGPDGKPPPGAGGAAAGGAGGAKLSTSKPAAGGAKPGDQKKETDVKPGAAAPPGGSAPVEGATKPDTAATASAAPADGTTPPAAGTTPPAPGTTPPAPGTTPPATGTTPPATGTTPPATGTTPPATGTTPPAAAPAPAATAAAPVASSPPAATPAATPPPAAATPAATTTPPPAAAAAAPAPAPQPTVKAS